MRLLQKEVLENRKGGTTMSFRYAQRRKRGRRKRYIRKAHSTLRRFRRFAPRSLKAIGFLQQSRYFAVRNKTKIIMGKSTHFIGQQ